MFLDGTYFQGNLVLPQYGRRPSNVQPGDVGYLTQTVGENTLEWFIARYEEEFLIKLLGLPLYEAWSAGLAVSEPAQIWLDLKGRIYRTVGGINLSPAAGYVYFFAMRQAASDTTMTGEKKQQGSFSDNVSPVRKMVSAWNDMIEAVHLIREWIYIHREEIAAVVQFDQRIGWCVEPFSPINEYGI